MPTNTFESVSTIARAEQLVNMFMEDHFIPDELVDDMVAEVEAAMLDLMGRYPDVTRQSFFYSQLESYMEDWLDQNMSEESAPHICGGRYSIGEILILGGWYDNVICATKVQFGGCHKCPVAGTCPLV